MANIYADAAPDLVTVFNNTPTIARTVVDQQSNLNSTLLAAIGLSNNAYDTLAPAEQNLIDAIKRLRAPLKVAADYSPEFGCLFARHRAGHRGIRAVARCSQGGPVHLVELHPGRAGRTPTRKACRSSTPPAGRTAVGCPTYPTKQSGGSWYRAPFLVTDNANIPYEPFTEMQVDAPVDAAVAVPRLVRRTGRLLMADGFESHRSMMVKVGIFTVTMLLVAAGLVVIFGEFRFGPSNTYHANFIDATRLKSGQKVRIAGVPVGSVKDVKLNPEQHRGRGFQRGQALHAVLVDAGGDPL